MVLNLDGTLWKPESVNLMFAHIREKAIAALRKRDAKRTAGACGPDNGFKVGEFPKQDEDGEDIGKYVINPVLQMHRHTGQEGRLLAQSRWAQYKAKPRDETKETEPLRMRQAAKQRDRAVKRAAAIEESLADAVPVESAPSKTKG